MRLCEICIERPVFASVLSLALLIFGLIGLLHIEIRYFPEVDYPIASVHVNYTGASPSLMKNEVTEPLENALINVKGLEQMTSTSSYNSTNIYLTFLDGTNMIKAMGDVRDQVSGVRNQLPDDVDPPSISEGGVASPVLNIGFLDQELTPAQIQDYVTQNIQPLLQKLPGMGAIWLYGSGAYAMRIWLNPEKMAALNITVMDVQNTLQNNNIDFSGGSIEGLDRQYSLVANTKLTDVDQFKNLIIRDANNQIVRMGDIAKVELGSNSLTPSPMRTNGLNSIDMEVRPLDTANPITVANEAKSALLKINLPDGLSMKITYDQSDYLKSAIAESIKTLLIAVILVILVVIIFLGSIRAALVPIVTIPVCIISVFGVMLLLGYTINTMTLLAIILAIGLVVDDAIVMLENIHRYIEQGLDPMTAAYKGSKEIGFSVVAMTLTLAAVYAPSGFTSGFSAKVFQEFAFTLAGAVLISGFVALTLSPMMCSRVLKNGETASRLEHAVDLVFEKINKNYKKILFFVLNKRLYVISALFFIGFLGYLIYLAVPQEFVPKEDIGFFEIDITSPPGSTISYTDGFMKQFEKIYAKTPGIENYLSFINSGNAINFIITQPWQLRKLETAEIMSQVISQLNQIPGVLVKGNLPDPVSFGDGTDGQAIQIEITSPSQDTHALAQTVDKVMRALKNYSGVRDVDTNFKFDNQVYEVDFKRAAAASYGVALQDIADTLSIMMSGKQITNIERDGNNYYVKVQMQMSDLSTFSGLDKIYVRSSNLDSNGNAVLVPLSNLISMHTSVRQNNLYRYNRMDSATITASQSPGYGLGQVVGHLNLILNNTLPKDQNYIYIGRIAAFIKSNGVMGQLFFLSIIFIYLVMAAQFESFVDPFIILLTVPLCIVGAMGTLYITGGSLNLYTNIGLITLVGLITKHGILITQFANQKLLQGEDLLTAIQSAAVIRLRPILMTTCAMVLGAVPLALAYGPDSHSHSQIGWVIVGGMVFGTFFSLIVIPVAYYYLAPLDHKKKCLLKKLAQT